MKSRVSTAIMSIVIILIIIVIILFGIILWNEVTRAEASIIQEGMQTVIPEDVQADIIEDVQTAISEEQPNNNITEKSNTIMEEEIKTPEILSNPFEDIRNGSSKKEDINYDGITINKFFYNQLEEEAKIIYKAFEANKENMKTGTYKIELGNLFTDVLEKDNGQDQLGKYYQSAIEAYMYDNPDVFYLSPNKMYLNIEKTTRMTNITYYVYINSGTQANYLVDEFSSREQINNAISQIEQVRDRILANKKSNTYDNIKMVHDYLIENMKYDTTVSKNNIYNIYGSMINGEAVCEGYAKSFKYLMDALDIPCTLTIGEATNLEGQTEKHAWNYVQLNGTWYAVDTTWDDPVSENGMVTQVAKVRYLLKGLNTMQKDHKPNGRFTDDGKVFTYPTLSIEDYYI